jgi:hypothetical protein
MVTKNYKIFYHYLQDFEFLFLAAKIFWQTSWILKKFGNTGAIFFARYPLQLTSNKV